MGELDIRNVKDIIHSCSTELSKCVGKLSNLDDEHFMFMIIILTQLIYAKYYKLGYIKNNICKISVRDIRKTDSKYNDLAISIILLRNMICHQYGSVDMNKLYYKIRNKSDEINNFIRYLIYDDSLQLAINKMNGI